MNFKVESRLLAAAMGAEHEALGALLERMGSLEPGDGWEAEFLAAKKAHETVRFQRERTDAARGVAAGSGK